MCLVLRVRGHWVKHFRLSFLSLPPLSSSCGIRHCEAFPSVSSYSKKIYAAISPFIFNHNRAGSSKKPSPRRGPSCQGAPPSGLLGNGGRCIVFRLGVAGYCLHCYHQPCKRFSFPPVFLGLVRAPVEEGCIHRGPSG